MTLCGYARPSQTREPGLRLLQIGDGVILEGEPQIALTVFDNGGLARQFTRTDRSLPIIAARPSPASKAISVCVAFFFRFLGFGTGVIKSEWRPT